MGCADGDPAVGVSLKRVLFGFEDVRTDISAYAPGLRVIFGPAPGVRPGRVILRIGQPHPLKSISDLIVLVWPHAVHCFAVGAFNTGHEIPFPLPQQKGCSECCRVCRVHRTRRGCTGW